MSTLLTALITVTAFFVGFFIPQPQQDKDDDGIEIAATVPVETEPVETEPVETVPVETVSVAIEEKLKIFYASILQDQETTFQDLLKDMKKDCSLPRGTTPLSFAIEHKKYAFGQMLLRSDFTATLQDLQKAEFFQNLETDPIKKDEATIFVNFLTQHLRDNKILPSTEQAQRGKGDGAAAAAAADAQSTDAPLANNTSNIFESIDYKFIQATEKGDVKNMESLIQQGANPNAIINCSRSLDVSIAHGQLGSLDFLLKQNIPITREDIEKASIYQVLHATNLDGKDRYCPRGVNKHGAIMLETIVRKRIFDKLVIQARAQTTAATTLSRDKKA